ncbi:MAG: HEAT repeat domain-containing protein [Archangium sp.]
MMRSALLVLAVVAAPVFAKPNTIVEAEKVMEEFTAGRMGINQAINRIQYLGQERYASAEAQYQLKRSSDRKTRALLLEFIASLGVKDPDAERTFVESLKSDDGAEVMTAARGLGRMKSKDAAKPLIGLLSSTVLGIRRDAARALGEIGSSSAGGPLIKAAKAETDLDVKVLMLVAAGRSGDKKQVPGLEAMLKDDSEATRLAAAQGLCAMGTASCATFAGKLLGSTDKNERFQAVMLFEGASAKASAPVLEKVLADPDNKLRARAARILVQGGDAKKIDWLVIESAKAKGEERLPYEDELEKLRLTDEQRQAILKKAGLQ